MEIHMSRLASFTTNGDNLSQIQTGSSRRRSFTQDSFFRDMQGETPGRRSSLHTRPFSYNQKSSVMKPGKTKDNLHFSLENSNLRFGVIPQELHYRLLDLDDYKSRTIAIEELKYLIQDFDFSSVVHSDVVGLVSFLCNLLDDKNFTVVHITLDVLNCLVINLAQGVDEFLPHVVASTVKVLGDSKITIKQEYMKIYMRLMKVVGPFKVLTILLEHLKHKYSRVREEVVNICIISLLTYPSEDFVLPFLACEIAPCLIDSKRKVRHAALEAFAVLAASMGPEKSSLLKAVDAVELLENGDGLMNAVQARLARKTLPRITPQGLIEYALPCPSSAQTRSTHHLPGADTNWLLTGNRVQSAQYHSGDHTGRNIVPHIDPVARRILSAGKGKNKLPWENQYPGALDVFPGNPTPVVLQPEQCSSRFDGHHTPIVKTPIAKTKTSASNTSPENPTNNANQPAVPAGKNESPIRLKAAMVRVPSARKDLNRTRPVPPITKMAPLSPSNGIVTSNQVNNQRKITENTLEDEKLGIDLSDLCLKDDEEDDPEEMNSSLRNVRNSAAKKRAKMTGSLSDLDSPDSMKMELNLDSPTMTSSPTNVSYSESGVYSRESLASPTSPVLHTRQISDVTSIPKSKARPPRLPSPRNKDTYKKLDHHHQGTSTQEKPVTVVGQRMHYRNGIIDAEEDHTKELSPGHTKHQPKDQQKPLKPMKGITGSASSFQQISSYDYDWTHSEGSVAIVGKGVFEYPSPVSRTHSQYSYTAAEDQSAVKQNIQPPAGIYGRAVQQNNSTAEIDTKVTMSKSARDKMRQKKECSIKEIVEIKDSETKDLVTKEQLHHTDPSPVITEIWRSKSDCAENVVEISPPTLKRTSSLKHSSVQSQYRDRKLSITRSSEVIDSSVLKELNKPEISVTEALRLMSDDDWEKKIEGLTLVRSLSTFHSHLVIERLHDLKLAVTHEVKNLRSSVSRAAIICLGDMFIYFKKNMDYELDNCVRVLLHKAGEPNTFIREDVDKALNAMVQNVTPVRALTSLINGGLSHLNSVVRKCTAQHLSDLVERMGPGRILSGIKDITDRVLPAIVKFAQDGSQETRFYGRKMLHFLMSHPDFDKMLEKYIPTKDLSYLKDLIRNIQQKGIGEIQDAPSARGRRSYHGSVSSLRASSVSQNTHSALER